LSAQQPVKLLAIGGASTPSTQKERVVAFLQPLRGAWLKRFIRRANPERAAAPSPEN
jgi:hypothetical protein